MQNETYIFVFNNENFHLIPISIPYFPNWIGTICPISIWPHKL